MDARKVTAIVRSALLERVERRLQDAGVPGLTVTRVKGFGEYANAFRHDWESSHARIEIFTTDRARAHDIARMIMAEAHTGGAGDGIVVVLPVETIYRIRTGAELTGTDLV